MAGLVPAIHVFLRDRKEDVDARPKAGMTTQNFYTRVMSNFGFWPLP